MDNAKLPHLQRPFDPSQLVFLLRLSTCRYESLEEHELGDEAGGSRSHGQDSSDGGLRGAELLAELKREVTKQVIAESRQVSASCPPTLLDAFRME